MAGGFVNVYSTAHSEEEALRIASAEVSEAGWDVLAVEDSFLLSREQAATTPESLEYFEQTLLDGVVVVFHTYPHDGEAPDVRH
ncbi:hypothetical protein FKV24_004535 [Lysobacter maris]|uniref:Uncharacterized protein n=1 Tax=Marilutibacter maris TaxID=1605891 RepID=A0A508AX26_9GAMM|nr:hypothetical protein [Lysobacter maris]KAB8196218.1 hypothetical protein FKV24_004535 [Lysobacter maris]